MKRIPWRIGDASEVVPDNIIGTTLSEVERNNAPAGLIAGPSRSASGSQHGCQAHRDQSLGPHNRHRIVLHKLLLPEKSRK